MSPRRKSAYSGWKVGYFPFLVFLFGGTGVIAASQGIWLTCGIILLLLIIALAMGVCIPALRMFGPVICSGPPDRKAVALTFDDGPDDILTSRILDFLKFEKVPATFFCIGSRVSNYPHLARRMVREGHLIANHTYSHRFWTNLLTTRELEKDIRRAQDVIERVTGVCPQYYRPPMGLCNPRMSQVAARLNLKVVAWTVRSLDTQATHREQIHERICAGIRPGAIVLMHCADISPGLALPALCSLIRYLKQEGYELCHLEDLLAS